MERRSTCSRKKYNFVNIGIEWGVLGENEEENEEHVEVVGTLLGGIIEELQQGENLGGWGEGRELRWWE